MSVLDEYNVSFGVQKIHHSEYKFIKSTMGSALGRVFTDMQSLRKSNDVLEIINDVIENSLEDVIYTTQSLECMIIKSSIITIYSGEDFDKDFKSAIPLGVLPTKDFKEILLAWMDFLAKTE